METREYLDVRELLGSNGFILYGEIYGEDNTFTTQVTQYAYGFSRAWPVHCSYCDYGGGVKVGCNPML